MNAPLEDAAYKHADYEARDLDPYAAEKYRLLEREVLGARRWPRALNVGCGSGELNLILAPRCDAVVGIDPDPVAVERATARAAAAGLTHVTIARRALEEPEPGPPFDLAVAFDVLEHLKDDRAALDRLAERLVPGGLLFLTLPAGPGLMGHHDVMLGHYRRYTREELRAKLSERFTVERCAYYGASLVPVALLFSRLLRRPYPVAAAGSAGLGTSLLRALLRGEASTTRLPFGTSLIAVARRR